MTGGRIVLLVDDSRVARMMTAAAVTRLRPGWTVVEASDGETALDCARKVRPHVIMLDVNMPGMGGLAAAASLRRDCPAAAITLLTANIQDPVRHQAEALGVGFLAKPLRDEDLAAFLDSGAPAP